jgi:hypothetical protein
MSGKIIARVRQRQAQTLTAQRRRELRAKMAAEMEDMRGESLSGLSVGLIVVMLVTFVAAIVHIGA